MPDSLTLKLSNSMPNDLENHRAVCALETKVFNFPYLFLTSERGFPLNDKVSKDFLKI